MLGTLPPRLRPVRGAILGIAGFAALAGTIAAYSPPRRIVPGVSFRVSALKPAAAAKSQTRRAPAPRKRRLRNHPELF